MECLCAPPLLSCEWGYRHVLAFTPPSPLALLRPLGTSTSIVIRDASVKADETLHVLVLGESLLNDAVGVILYQMSVGLKNGTFSGNLIEKQRVVLFPYSTKILYSTKIWCICMFFLCISISESVFI